jgi:adenine-specific DNA glycosylase
VYYILVACGGLGLGIGLLTWLLIERTKKHEAETTAAAAKVAQADAERKLKAMTETLGELRIEMHRISAEAEINRKNLLVLRGKLEHVNDPEFVKKMLDELLGS